MKLHLLCFCLFLFSKPAFAQKEDSKVDQAFRIGLYLGANFTKYRNTDYDLKYGTQSYIGVYSDFRIDNRLWLSGSITHSTRSSSHRKPQFQLKAEYVDYSLGPRVQIGKDFYLHAGVCFSQFIRTYNSYAGIEDDSKKQIIEDASFYSELNVLAGFEVRLGRLVNVQFNYLLPGAARNSLNYQIGFKFFLNNKKKYKDPASSWDTSPYTSEIVHSEKNGIVYPSYVDKAPVYQSGLASLNIYLEDNVRVYPRDVRVYHEEHSATNIYMLRINELGEVESVEIFSSVAEYAHYSYESKFLEKEIKRVFSEMPNWTPAQKNGENVSLNIYIPLNFMVYPGEITMLPSNYIFSFDDRD